MSGPRLSVVIPTRDGGARLLALLDALRAERAAGLDLEVVVVDDGSRDRTAERVARDHPWARLARHARSLGFARSCNDGRRSATGRLVLFLNDDAVPRPGALERLARRLDEHPDVAAVGPRLVDEAGGPQLSCTGPLTPGALLHRVRLLRWTRLFRRAHEAFRRREPPASPGPVPCLTGAALLVRRADAEAEPWDEGFPFGVEDADLCARLARRGALHLVPDAVVVHAGGVATGAHRRFALGAYEAGFLRWVAGRHGRRAATAWALLVALDGPLRVAVAAAAAARGLLRGRLDAAGQALAVLAAATVDLPRTWRGARRVGLPGGSTTARRAAPDGPDRRRTAP